MAMNPSDSMQMEAVRRMQEMHGRSRSGSQHPKPRENEAPKPQPPEPPPSPAPVVEGAATETAVQPQDIAELFADKDRTLVLIIILLLLGEHSDTSLVMALVYLIL